MNDTPTDRYRVVLLDAGGQCAGWLSHRLRLVNAAWMAGDFSWAEAKDFARWARTHIKGGMEFCTWHVVPDSPDSSVRDQPRERAVTCRRCGNERAWNFERICEPCDPQVVSA